MRFLADECLDGRLVAWMLGQGLDVMAARDLCRGASDGEVLALARQEGRVLLTEDKDFGELALRAGRSARGIVLFRDLGPSLVEATAAFGTLLATHGRALAESFAVIRGSRVRVRRLVASK